jgi:glycosyltransferase involved in cell wall biosynthesis
MKILFIAMANSIHTARWIKQISADKTSDRQVIVFPSMAIGEIHSLFENVTIYPGFYSLDSRFSKKSNVDIKGINLRIKFLTRVIFYIIGRYVPDWNKKRLNRLIRKVKPDIIHTLETQTSGYLLADVKREYFKNKLFPLWWHTNWGSDIYLFGRLKDHKDKIREVLSECDYYSCECNRDVELAKKFGFNKVVMPVYPNSGGFDLEHLRGIRIKLQKPSNRKIIMLKGYQGWAGRSLVAIRALSKVKDQLKGYTIVIYTYQGIDVKIAAELLSQDSGIDVTFLPEKTNHDDMLMAHGMARISIGLSISDAISTSVLESMAMGSFPIQSWTSAADEWFANGVGGLLVPPEDPEDVAAAIVKALQNDEMVDKAYEINWRTIEERLDYNTIKDRTLNSYQKIMESKRNL